MHPILIGTAAGIATNNCQGCHEETALPLPIAPFFANDDVNTAYEAAKSKMDIDSPANSRFVVRPGQRVPQLLEQRLRHLSADRHHQ